MKLEIAKKDDGSVYKNRAAAVKSKSRLSRKTKGEVFYIILICILMTLAAVITLYPFINTIATSFSSSRAIMAGEVVWKPVEFTLDSYQQVIEDGQILYAFKNSVIIALVGTALSMAFTVLCAYPLSRKRFFGRSVFLKIITVTLVFNGGMIPNFILIRQLHLMDTYWSLWLSGAISTFYMIVMKTQFESIPDALEEAAAIDGANDLYILFKIMLPISLPTLATLTLFYMVGYWNSYMNVIMYLTDSKKYNMAAKLMQMIENTSDAMLQMSDDITRQQITPEGFKATSIVLSTVPILIVYPFLQKYFVSGIMVGSVKG